MNKRTEFTDEWHGQMKEEHKSHLLYMLGLKIHFLYFLTLWYKFLVGGCSSVGGGG